MPSTPPRLNTLSTAGTELLFTAARTASRFADTPVSDDELRNIWNLARWSPSSANSQPLRVLFVRTSEGRKRVSQHMFDSNSAKTLAAPVVAVLAYDRGFVDLFSTTFPQRAEVFRAQFADLPADTVSDIARYNAALQSGVFLLAVRANGLAAGPMTGFDNAAMDAEFFDGGTWRSHLVVNIGHPGDAAWHERLPRVPEDTALRWL